MIDIVINYDSESGEFKLYEPTTDTLLVTTSLGESFNKISDFLKQQNMIVSDILNTTDINYHIDSLTFIALVKSNADLLKRLNTAPSGFTISSQRMGMTGNNNNSTKDFKGKSKQKTGTFSKTAFNTTNKKFGNTNT